MTEQKESSAMPEQTAEQATQQPKLDRMVKNSDNSNKISLIAIFIAIAVGAGSCVYVQHQTQQQHTQTLALDEKIAQLQHQASVNSLQVSQELSANQNALQQSERQQQTLNKTLTSLLEKVTSLTGNDRSIWLISAADYSVKIAGRKLWSDQDTKTAVLLLKSADSNLAQLDDPSVIDVRRALAQDISNLDNLNQVDYDGIILQLNQLTNDIDNLRLADNAGNDSPMDEDSSEVSHSLSHWRQNLISSWHDFMDNFITVRRRDNTAQPLLAPDQEIYLRENIRSSLLVAAQAVPRHQNETYKQSLESVSTWIRAWYDVNNPATKSFLAQLEQLEQQSIDMDLPETLSSQPLLERLLQSRSRSITTSPKSASTANHQGD